MGHAGGISGFSSYIARFPQDDLTVVVLANHADTATQALAFEIAGSYLPRVAAALAAEQARRNAVAIPDPDPKITILIRSTFEKMIDGTVDRELFTTEMQELLFPNALIQMKTRLGNQGSIRSFELLTADDTQGSKRRTYRVTFEAGMKLRINFTIDSEGKIAGVSMKPEQ
jgi:hypothetical protein